MGSARKNATGSPFARGRDQKPVDRWMTDDHSRIVCPFCGTKERSDDKLGRHFVHYHWREIEFATRRIRNMNERERR